MSNCWEAAYQSRVWVPCGASVPCRAVPAASSKQLQSTMDKMRNMAVKRDSMRKSFIGDPNGKGSMPAAPAPDTVAEEKEGGDDLSAYL